MNLEQLANWVTAAEKFAVFTNQSSDAEGIVSQMVAVAAAAESPRVVLFAHTYPETFPTLRLRQDGATEPGSATFKFKTLAGIPKLDSALRRFSNCTTMAASPMYGKSRVADE